MSQTKEFRKVSSFPTIKLTGQGNYTQWSILVSTHFETNGVLRIVQGEEPKLVPFDDNLMTAAEMTDLAYWKQRDAYARECIMQTVDENQLQLITAGHHASSVTSENMWTTLKTLYTPSGMNGLYGAFTALVSAKFVDGENLDTHIARVRSLANDCANCGHVIDDKLVAIIVLFSMPQSWSTVVQIIETTAPAAISLESVIVKLKNAAKVSERTVGPADTASAGALAARIGHHAPGYNAATSPSSVSTSPQPFRGKCYKCGQRGHIDRNCRNAPIESASANKVSSQTQVVELLHVFADESSAMSTSTDAPQQHGWIVDSGADRHFTGDRRDLTNFVNEPLSVTVANGGRVVCPGYGTVALRSESGAGLELSKVYHLPGSKIGLISVAELAKDGIVANFLQESVSLHRKGVLVASSSGSGYVLDLTLDLSPSAYSTRASVGMSLMGWHRRLGHISLDLILAMEKDNLVNGIVLTDRIKSDCEACIVAKSKRAPFVVQASVATALLQRVYVDLGFVETPDRDGRSIFLVIVDQYSAAKWSFILANKQSATIANVFEQWLVAAENSSGCRLKEVRSDNGGEFVGKAFVDVLRLRGIRHEPTAPYTPEQNGKAERLNGSLLGLVCAMLRDSGLDKSYWSDALGYATFVLNRIPHPTLKTTTPYELWYGRKPSVSHLKPFGATAYVHVNEHNRHKLDACAIVGVLVGYATNSQNYRVWVPSLKTIVVTRHATFGRLESKDLAIPGRNDEEVFELDTFTDRPVLMPSPLPAVPPAPVQLGPNEVPAAKVPAARDVYFLIRTGYDPTPHAEVNQSNIVDGKRIRRPVVRLVQEDESVFVRLVSMVSVANDDDVWEAPDEVFVGVVLPNIPRNYSAALSSVESQHWKTAIELELAALDEHGVFELTSLPPGAKALGSTWVFARKENADGSIERYKARLVAQGFGQRPGIDVNETFAPVARMSTVRFLIAVAAAKGLSLEQFDFTTAFLNGTMTEDVYMKIPNGYKGHHAPGDVLRLVKSMYGTRQAPREWYRAVSTLMFSRGYVAGDADPCLFVKHVEGEVIVMLLYVDDGIAMSANSALIDLELAAIHDIYKLKRLGRLHYYLSLEVVTQGRSIVIHQRKYAKEILDRYGFENVGRGVNTPVIEGPADRDEDSPLLDAHDKTEYQSAVGALQYLCQLSRPDLAFAI